MNLFHSRTIHFALYHGYSLPHSGLKLLYPDVILITSSDSNFSQVTSHVTFDIGMNLLGAEFFNNYLYLVGMNANSSGEDTIFSYDYTSGALVMHILQILKMLDFP